MHLGLKSNFLVHLHTVCSSFSGLAANWIYTQHFSFLQTSYVYLKMLSCSI